MNSLREGRLSKVLYYFVLLMFSALKRKHIIKTYLRTTSYIFVAACVYNNTYVLLCLDNIIFGEDR